MESVLLVGEANYVIGGIYKSLYEKYRVQICAANKVLVENMISIVEPRLILIGMYGTDNFDKNILEYFQHLNPRIPVIFIGTFEECKDYITIYNDRLFDFLERPVTQRDIEKKCEEVINKSGMTKEKTGNSDGSEKKAKQKILVVDDSGVFLRTIKSLLELRYDMSIIYLTLFFAKNSSILFCLLLPISSSIHIRNQLVFIRLINFMYHFLSQLLCRTIIYNFPAGNSNYTL